MDVIAVLTVYVLAMDDECQEGGCDVNAAMGMCAACSLALDLPVPANPYPDIQTSNFRGHMNDRMQVYHKADVTRQSRPGSVVLRNEAEISGPPLQLYFLAGEASFLGPLCGLWHAWGVSNGHRGHQHPTSV